MPPVSPRKIDPASVFVSFMDAALIVMMRAPGGMLARTDAAIELAPIMLSSLLDEGALTAEGKRHGRFENMNGCWHGASVLPPWNSPSARIHMGSWLDEPLGEPLGDTLTVGAGVNAVQWTNIRLRTSDVLGYLMADGSADPPEPASTAEPEQTLQVRHGGPQNLGPTVQVLADAIWDKWAGVPAGFPSRDTKRAAIWEHAKKLQPALKDNSKPSDDSFDRAEKAVKAHQ